MKRPASSPAESFKQLFDLLGRFIEIAEDERLSVIHYVEVAVLTRRIDIVPKIHEHVIYEAGLISEHETDIRRVKAFLPHQLIFFHDRFVTRRLRVYVRNVEIDEIDTEI